MKVLILTIAFIAGIVIGTIIDECKSRHDRLVACEKLFLKDVR